MLEGKKGISMKHRLRYRTTPHSTTGVTPAELMVKRRLRTILSLIKPNLAQVAENKQEKQKMYKDLKCKRDRPFVRNDRVRLRNSRTNYNSKTDNWIYERPIGETCVSSDRPTSVCICRTFHHRRISVFVSGDI